MKTNRVLFLLQRQTGKEREAAGGVQWEIFLFILLKFRGEMNCCPQQEAFFSTRVNKAQLISPSSKLHCSDQPRTELWAYLAYTWGSHQPESGDPDVAARGQELPAGRPRFSLRQGRLAGGRGQPETTAERPREESPSQRGFGAEGTVGRRNAFWWRRESREALSSWRGFLEES